MGKAKHRRVEKRDETKNFAKSCEICRREFKCPSGIKAHKKVHRSVECEVCARCLTFTTKVKLLELHGEGRCVKVDAVKAKKQTKKDKKMRKMESPGGYVV